MLRLFEEIRRWLPLTEHGEWSIEANPQDVDRELCLLLHEQGNKPNQSGGTIVRRG